MNVTPTPKQVARYLRNLLVRDEYGKLYRRIRRPASETLQRFRWAPAELAALNAEIEAFRGPDFRWNPPLLPRGARYV